MKKDYEISTGKTVLLYSGGLDSFIISKLQNFDTLLYINIGSRYSQIEMKYIKKQNLPNLIIDNRLNLGDVEDPNHFLVPARNLFFATIASFYGDKITMGALSGDRSSDKDEKFADLTSGLLQHIYKQSWWCEERKVEILLPYKNYTKSQLIAEYLNKSLNINDLVHGSFSCYSPTHDGKPCGTCKPCLRKWMSLRPYRNTKDLFAQNPELIWKDKVVEIKKNIGDPILSRGQEDIETLKTWETFYK